MGVVASAAPAIAGRPERIVALAPSAAEILVALGAAGRVVGISDFAKDIPEVSGSVHLGGFRPDLERVLSLRPDLVVVSKDGTDKNSFDQLVRLKVPILVTSGNTLEGVFSDIQIVGMAIGEEKRARELILVLKRRVAKVRATLASRPAGRPIPTVLVLIWPDPPVVAGPSSFIGDALKQAGIPSAVPGEAGEWPRVSLETIASWNPGVIIHPETEENRDVFQRAMTGNAQWKVVSAFMRGNVRSIPGAWLERPGPRLVDALERLAAQLEAGRK
jgi:iron complex transport system substrate-binding protein